MNTKRYVYSLVALALISLLFMYWNSLSHLEKKIVQSLPQKSPENLLPIEVKRAVNQALAPDGATYPKTQNAQGITIDVSRRAASVSTAVIDEKGQVHIVDYTSPIKE